MRKWMITSSLLAALILVLVACSAQPEPPEPSAATQAPISTDTQAPALGMPETAAPDLGGQPLAATPAPPYPAQGGGEASGEMVRGDVRIEESGLILSSSPFKIELSLVGSLPNPCYQLKADISAPDEKNQFHVEVYGEAEASANCTQVLEPFDERISLPVPSVGEYTVWVNGEQVGSFNVTSGGIYP